jgi:hypothetical protein
VHAQRSGQCTRNGSQSLDPAGWRWLSFGAGPAVRQPRIALRDSADRTDPELSAEKIENTQAKHPTEPMDRMEPAEPMDRMDPLEPIERMDPLEPMDSIEPDEPAESGERDALRSVPMGAFSHCPGTAMRAANA